jgi:hypothetical protein
MAAYTPRASRIDFGASGGGFGNKTSAATDTSKHPAAAPANSQRQPIRVGPSSFGRR